MSISNELDQIKNAVYGREVRDAIHDGIKKTYDDASKDGNANMEVSLARGGYPVLNDRLDKVDDNLQQTSAQLAQTPTKDEVILKTEGVGLDEAKPDLLAAIEGGEGTTFNLLSIPRDESVTYDKAYKDLLGKILEGRNIFHKDTIITDGYYIDNAGNLVTSTTLGVSDFVEVVPNQYYILPSHANLSGCLFDKNKAFIGSINANFTDGVAGTNNNPAIFKVPSNAKYVRVNVNTVDPANGLYKGSYMIVFGKTYPPTYVEYGADGFNILVGQKQIKNRSITVDHFKDILTNLFNKTKITEGYYLNSTGSFVVSANGNLGYSEYIEVKPNTTYSVPGISGVNGGGFFDENKTWISYIATISGSTTTFMSPSNAKYVVVNVNILDPESIIHKDTYMLVESNKYPSKYFAYNLQFIPWIEDYIPESGSSQNKWDGKTLYTYGDSITWYDGNNYTGNHNESGKKAIGYQSYIRDELGAIVQNHGVSGRTIPQIMDIIKSKNNSIADGVTITGGVNDWGLQTPIGQIAEIGSNFDTTTSYGALQSAIEYLISQKPKLKIYLITPIRGMFKEESENSLAGQEFPRAYQEMFFEVGKLYGLPVCDWYDLTGFNKANYASWYQDKVDTILGDRYIHVGDEGYKRMAEILVPFLRDN